MEDIHFLGLLSVPVNATVALLQSIWVPWDLVMNEPMAVPLEIDPFARGIGRKQNAYRRLLRIELECSFHSLPFLRVLRTV
jgi:hypothetical protein